MSANKQKSQNQTVAEISGKLRGTMTAGDSAHPNLDAFKEILESEITSSERDSVGVGNIVHIAQSLLEFSETRPSQTPLIRIYNPTFEQHGWVSEHTILELVCDDQPFLVDSVLGELNAENLTLYAVLHPIISFARNDQGTRQSISRIEEDLPPGTHAESVIHVEFQRHSDQEFLKQLENRILELIRSVYQVVDDFGSMRTRLYEMIGQLESFPSSIPREKLEDTLAFLHWLRDNHFTFLGSRMYEFSGDLEAGELEPIDGSGLGLLHDPDLRILRRSSDNTNITPEIREFLALPTPIIVTKSNIRSQIHRRVYMDYIGIKRFDRDGNLIGECRFIGLFTAEAYSQSLFNVPLLAQKAERVLQRAKNSPYSYNYKALRNILEHFPRDEIFNVTEDELTEVSTQILDLYERPRTRLFLRKDRFDRYASALVFVPRDRYSSDIREKIANVLIEAFDGRLSAYYPFYDDTPLARVQLIIGFDQKPDPARIDPVLLEQTVIEVTQNWTDEFQNCLNKHYNEEEAHKAFIAYSKAFSVAYRENTPPEDAINDIDAINRLQDFPDIRVRTYKTSSDDSNVIKFKIYRAQPALVLSDILPILENMGFRVLHESEYPVLTGQNKIWIHEFDMELNAKIDQDIDKFLNAVDETFLAVWNGRTENDVFNRLVTAQGLEWRFASLFRTFARYQRQIGHGLSYTYIINTLIKYSTLTNSLIKLFDTKFNPELEFQADIRKETCEEISKQILADLENVAGLDEDRIFRRLLNLIESIWRTNYYQPQSDGQSKSYISIKISSRSLEEMPEPRPFAEIFVYSPRIEGVHLRWGKVARGGLRWSDRREDYRTEILGLVKAQKVKNAVIVPVGAKGGFVARKLDTIETPEGKREEGIASYRTFISGLLDITDNIVSGNIKKPANVICHDEDDPYLVVAADKGTATFSDIANEMSLSYNFWLGDAFASGGSNGYDHKVMGITARGAWEAVKRHFREMGKNIQAEPFTAAGVGDMSGDVFGNGMLLSPHTKLIAAFDHRNIFIDPDPDIKTSFEERQRLFALPSSSWEDYNKNLISEGGGVFSRSAKSITLTPEIKKVLELEVDKITTVDLMRAILRAPIDLLWFGGIGTYIKADDEHDSEAGDRANDHIRITASEVQAKVIGEGANLGVTQKGRIGIAKKGGRINSDAIDNSAGVDCSDHEVNIKILLENAITNNKLNTEERNALLEKMTEEVAALVLKHNYTQTLTLSLAESTATSDLDAHKRLIHNLESDGFLDRTVEFLPNDEELTEREQNQQGLTRPELAVLLAYAKLRLFEDLCASNLCESEDLQIELQEYFPQELQNKYPDEILNHQLRKEIIATILSNETINAGGIPFVNRINENTGRAPEEIVSRTVITDRIFEIAKIRDQINALDNQISAADQFQLHRKVMEFQRREVIWFLRDAHAIENLSISSIISNFKSYVDLIRTTLFDCLSESGQKAFNEQKKELLENGLPEDLATSMASLDFMASATDISELATRKSIDPILAAKTYFALGEEMNIDVFRIEAKRLRALEHWDRLALRRAVEDFDSLQSELTESVLQFASMGSEDLLSLWLTTYNEPISRIQKLLDSIANSGEWTVSKLALAAGELRQLAIAVEADRNAGLS